MRMSSILYLWSQGNSVSLPHVIGESCDPLPSRIKWQKKTISGPRSAVDFLLRQTRVQDTLFVLWKYLCVFLSGSVCLLSDAHLVSPNS